MKPRRPTPGDAQVREGLNRPARNALTARPSTASAPGSGRRGHRPGSPSYCCVTQAKRRSRRLQEENAEAPLITAGPRNDTSSDGRVADEPSPDEQQLFESSFEAPAGSSA